jgi:hypothetical protein
LSDFLALLCSFCCHRRAAPAAIAIAIAIAAAAAAASANSDDSMNTMLAAVISKSINNLSHVVGLAFTNSIAISSGGIGMQSSAVHGRAVARNSCYCEAPTLRSNATTSGSLLSMANKRGDAP